MTWKALHADTPMWFHQWREPKPRCAASTTRWDGEEWRPFPLTDVSLRSGVESRECTDKRRMGAAVHQGAPGKYEYLPFESHQTEKRDVITQQVESVAKMFVEMSGFPWSRSQWTTFFVRCSTTQERHSISLFKRRWAGNVEPAKQGSHQRNVGIPHRAMFRHWWSQQ